MPVQALEGMMVLDFCWVAAGPMTTKYLAEYGATVVRVESAKRPDSLRRAAPYGGGVSGINRSGYFANYNANKYGITIDMRHTRARELVLRMVSSWASVVTENFTPGTMEGWGLGYDEMKQARPDLIMFSASMLGRGGPLEKQPGFGAVLSSLAGLTNITGWPDRGPVNPYGAYTDFIVPRFAVAAILAAVDYRRRTAEGIHLDMSQLEASLHFSAPLLMDYMSSGVEPIRRGNRDPAAAPHGVYPCQGDERWIAIACFSEETWQRLRQRAAQAQFATLLGRKAAEDELDQLMAEWTRGWDAQALMKALQNAGVPAGVVRDTRGLFEDPQLQHRGHFQYLDHAEIGRYATERSEFELSRTPGKLERPAPMIGEHTAYVLKQFIGLSDAEYQSFEDDAVLE